MSSQRWVRSSRRVSDWRAVSSDRSIARSCFHAAMAPSMSRRLLSHSPATSRRRSRRASSASPGDADRRQQHVAERGVVALRSQVVLHPRERLGMNRIGRQHFAILLVRVGAFPGGREGLRLVERALHLLDAGRPAPPRCGGRRGGGNRRHPSPDLAVERRQLRRRPRDRLPRAGVRESGSRSPPAPPPRSSRRAAIEPLRPWRRSGSPRCTRGTGSRRRPREQARARRTRRAARRGRGRDRCRGHRPSTRDRARRRTSPRVPRGVRSRRSALRRTPARRRRRARR